MVVVVDVLLVEVVVELAEALLLDVFVLVDMLFFRRCCGTCRSTNAGCARSCGRAACQSGVEPELLLDVIVVVEVQLVEVDVELEEVLLLNVLLIVDVLLLVEVVAELEEVLLLVVLVVVDVLVVAVVVEFEKSTVWCACGCECAAY